MATIQTMIRLRDYMSQPLTKIAESTERVSNRLNELSNNMKSASSNASVFSTKLGRVISSYSALYALSNLVQLSDDMALSASRLELVLEKLGETSKSVAEYQNEIYAAAQSSRGSYIEMQKSVSKLGMLAGDAFTDTEEIAAFTEQLNKLFVLSGAGSREQSMAMYQLTQAMASGRLQGDEYRSIIENASMLAKCIEKYMREVEGATGSMKDWSSQGLLTAEVIKNAVAYAQDETNKSFESMSYTWGQVWQMMKNTAVKMSQPILELINLIINNWDFIRPVIIGVGAALLVYYVGPMLKSIAVTVLKTAADWAATAAIVALTLAQDGLNAALQICNLTLGKVLIGLIVIVTIIYLAVAAFNKLSGESVSATGIIVGAVCAAGAIIWNVIASVANFFIGCFVAVWNFLASFANFFANLLNDPAAAIAHLIADLCTTVLSLLSTLAQAIDTIFGTDLVEGVNGWIDKVNGWADSIGNGKYSKEAKIINPSDYYIKHKSVTGAYNWGYDKGSNLFGWGSLDPLKMTDTDASSLGQNAADTAKNTAKTADAVTKSSEDLKWLREIAERKAINQFTTAEIKVDMSGMQNNISKELDLDGVVSYLENTLTETMASVAEGNHV